MSIFRKKNLALAVDVGGTNLRTGIVDAEGKIIVKKTVKTTKKGTDGVALSMHIVGEIKNILAKKEKFEKRINGIGVSVAGPIDPKKRAIVNPPNMAFREIPVKKMLEDCFRLPATLLNDAKAGALAEKKFGAGKNFENFVYITISSGIGAGVIANGQLLRGKDGNAGEIGHLTVDTCFFLPCSCRKGRGHWEAYASGRNLPKFFRAWVAKNGGLASIMEAKPPRAAKDIFDLARAKNPGAIAFMKTLGKINGRGISNVIAAYDPEIIILGGAVALRNFDLILKYARPNIEKFLRTPKIVKSKLGDDAPLVGAGIGIMNQES